MIVTVAMRVAFMRVEMSLRSASGRRMLMIVQGVV
jgi:hypothetical protein